MSSDKTRRRVALATTQFADILCSKHRLGWLWRGGRQRSLGQGSAGELGRCGPIVPQIVAGMGTTNSIHTYQLRNAIVTGVTHSMGPCCDGTHVQLESAFLSAKEIRVSSPCGSRNRNLMSGQGGWRCRGRQSR